MDTDSMATVAAAATGLAVALGWRDSPTDRLLAMLPDAEAPPTAIGTEAALHAVIARLRGGGTPSQAFEEVGRLRFATARLTPRRIARALSRRREQDETDAQINAVALYAAQACALSERIGCPASSTLEAVAREQHRLRVMEERRKQVFAAPQATIRLLTMLPIATVLLGEVIGSRPVVFLLGSPAGWTCLGLGACWYVAGLAWTRRLLANLGASEGRLT